jgi:hypothetical protein
MSEQPLEQFGIMAKIGDGLAFTTGIAVIASYLPTVFIIVSIVWTTIRVYETRTVQNIIAKIRGKNDRSLDDRG